MSKRLLKGLLLGLILGAPVLIYLFLQGFGENKYALHVFYGKGVIEALENPPKKREYEVDLFYMGEGDQPQWYERCNFNKEVFQVPEADFSKVGGGAFSFSELATAYVVVFHSPEVESSATRFLSSELNRLRKEFSANELQFVLLVSEGSFSYEEIKGEDNDGWHVVVGEREKRAQWANCGLAIPHALGREVSTQDEYLSILTLVDQRGRVRGYFEGDKQQETDRLGLEVRVLLQEDN